MKSIELFAGAGGLALATANAGFHHTAVFEWNSNACATLRRNQALGSPHLRNAQIIEGDIAHYEFCPYLGEVELVSGGPPCQPFSMGGKHGGMDDERNMFPHAIRAVREIRPKAFIFENVKGLLRESFANYYQYIIHQLKQAKSDWDVVHPGRSWADKCKGKTPSRKEIVAGVDAFLSRLGKPASQISIGQ